MSSIEKLLHNAEYLTSASQLNQCPPDFGGEVAFAGRSNAGKSSAINALSGSSKLARTSKTPGRTQLINFFQLNEQLRIVDLPGYGYAKVPEKVKREWQKNIDSYLRNRNSLKGLILVMDVRHPLTEFDLMMLEWADAANMPVHILLTKSDKLKNGPAKTAYLDVKKALVEWQDLVSVQLFSALKKSGLDEAKQTIDGWFQQVPDADVADFEPEPESK